MEEHLKSADHFSASEYILEAKRTSDPLGESPSSSSKTNTNQSSYLERKVAYMKKRASLINLQTTDQYAVFCPKPECRLFMSSNVLAGALHFKYAHSPDRNIEIYSIGKLERVQEVKTKQLKNIYFCFLTASRILIM